MSNTIIDIIRSEIQINFISGITTIEQIDGMKFVLHCSKTIYLEFLTEIDEIFKNSVPILIEKDKSFKTADLTRFALPLMGEISLQQDMEQGYRIEKL
jgi:hypothetical protein